MGASVGIRPKADGENIVLTDTHRDLVDDVTATTDEFGTVLGEGINEISATAKSANDSAGELAARVKVLEEALGAPTQTAAFEATSDVADSKRQYVRWEGEAPAGWRRDSATITPPAGWYRVKLWITLDSPVSISGVGVSGDVPLAHVGLTAPAVDMVANVTGGINVRYRADGPVTFRLEITQIKSNEGA